MATLRTLRIAPLAVAVLGLANAGDLESPSGGMQLHSKLNVQAGMETFAQAAPNILDPTTTNYVFGRTISRRALAVQVHVANKDKSYDLLVHEIGLEVCKPQRLQPVAETGSKGDDVKALRQANRLLQSRLELLSRSALQKDTGDFQCPVGSQIFQMSSLDKYVLQGLADRGQSQDLRNMGLRIITGVGAAATPLPTVIAHLGHSFIPATASWNGPLVDVYKGLFPDYTVNQIVRLSNSAFETNKVVPKQSSAKTTIFLPIDMVLNKAQIHQFRHDPNRIYTDAVQNYRVVIDAQFIVAATPSQEAQNPPAPPAE